MLNPKTSEAYINNFILIKYVKTVMDAPDHVGSVPKLRDWNDYQEMMFRTMVEQIHYFYPKSTIHILTNEKNKNTGKLIWHYKPNIAENHSVKLLLYGLIDQPAMYLDTDILLVKHFTKRNLITSAPFNIYQFSNTSRDLQTLSKKPLEVKMNRQYNCGLIWIARPSQQIVQELKKIKEEYFDDKQWIESNGAWFNNDEHPVSYFVKKYNFKMNIFPKVNAFRRNLKYSDIFSQQSIHYTGVKNKELFVREYKDLCKSRIRIFT